MGGNFPYSNFARFSIFSQSSKILTDITKNVQKVIQAPDIHCTINTYDIVKFLKILIVEYILL